jgi:3-hydroxyisobutyrate dehydrogenase-like beta-hydroxyacid dehydrogenase
MSMPHRLGVVGLGPIGTGVARALANAGHDVVVFDVRPEPAAALADVATSAATLPELSDARVVFVAVHDDAQVREVLDDDRGILAPGSSVQTIVILSTVTLDTIRWAEERAARHGAHVLDCGVTGGRALGERGKIVAMVGGDEAAVEAARPVLEAFGEPTVYTGALGTGMQAKLARNMIIYGRWYTIWEALRLAEAGGVPFERMLDICAAADDLQNPLAEIRRGALPGEPPTEGDRALRERLSLFIHKDLRAALERAEELGVSAQLAALVEREHEEMLGIAGDPAAAAT